LGFNFLNDLIGEFLDGAAPTAVASSRADFPAAGSL
jgi:hypothetical protein